MAQAPSGQLLVVDDDREIRLALELLLQSAGYEVTTASSGEEALAQLELHEPDAALVDLRLPMLQGTEVIERARVLRPDVEYVVVTADGTYESAVEALRVGAYDFVEKPFSNDHLLLIVRRAVEHRRMRLVAEEHRRRIEALSTLHAVAHASGASLDVAEILDAAIDITVARAGVDAAAVYLFDEAGERCALVRHRGLDPALAARLAVPGVPSALHASAVRADAPAQLARADVPPGDPLAAAGFEAYCVTRVGTRERPVGTLIAASRSPRRFTESETALLEAIGRELGPPIQNARIHEQATRQAAQLRAVHDITRAINSAQELATVLQHVVRAAQELVDASTVTLLLPTEDGASLRVGAGFGDDGAATLGMVFPMHGSLNGLAFRLGRTLESREITSDPRIHPSILDRIKLTSLVVIPLVHGGRSLGTLAVVDRHPPPHFFSASDVEVLRLLAEQAAIAIDNARLRDVERAQTAALEARVEERTRELREAQEQLIKRERLAILGRMAGSVSHEIRNPLNVLKNSIYFLRMVLEGHPDPETTKQLSLMDVEVDRANRIVGDLLEYARVRDPSPRPLALADVFARVLDECDVPTSVTVTTDFPADVPPAMADADQLQVVFTNLVRNALQAMPEGGTLTLRVTGERDGVVGEVRDTGAGITPEVRERIFEPLVTTKIKGLGLGLATAKNLVEMHRGTISVQSEPGQGTVVQVRLPVAAGRPTVRTPGASGAGERGTPHAVRD